MKIINFKDLNQADKNLVLSAEQATKTSYSPYSNFSVGAAILTKTGKIITGSNLENFSFGLTICAERAVVAKANSLGERNFKSIAVIAKDRNKVKKNQNIFFTPCGACRQVLFEFSKISGVDLKIIISNEEKSKVVLTKISELLPLAFTF